jgi:Spy/CpxP family protein refolding chaperone
MKTLSLVASLALLALSLSIAQDKGNPNNRFGADDRRMLGQLKLTDDQRKDVEKLRFDLRKKSVDQQARLKTSRLELAELFKADNPDQSAIQKKASDISQLQSQQRAMLIDHWFAVNKLLTPDQQKVWKRLSARLLMNQRAQAFRERATQFQRQMRNHMRMWPAPGAMGR